VSAAIVTLTRFPDIFERLRASVDRWEPDALKVVVNSGGARIDAPGWVVVPGIDPFVFARNANIGIAVTGTAAPVDVLLVNDDCELTGPVLQTCAAVVRVNQSVGVLSPQVIGGVGNKLQRFGVGGLIDVNGYYASREHLSFVCVYIPASTRTLVGELDERYDGYGADDRDYCWRVQDAGLELGVTPLAVVRHGHGGQVSSSSFMRVMTRAQQDVSKQAMHRKFEEKFKL
jgi:GT2 family glycosyltransferase